MTEPTWADYTVPETIDVRGATTAYRRDGAGAPLLYLHGAGLTRRWLPLYRALASGHDVIVPEHPGFGDSEPAPWLDTFTDLAIHYADLLDALGTGPVHLVGHAYGGWLAAEFAGIYPERVASLTLVAPIGLRPDAEEALPDPFRMDAGESLQALLGADAGRWLEYLDEGDEGDATIQQYQENTALARLVWNPRYDLRLPRRLARVDAPAQVIVPETDRISPPSVARQYAEAIPGAELVTLHGNVASTEHLLVLQEPAGLAALISHVTTEGAR